MRPHVDRRLAQPDVRAPGFLIRQARRVQARIGDQDALQPVQHQQVRLAIQRRQKLLLALGRGIFCTSSRGRFVT
jgi:hypothetical protein